MTKLAMVVFSYYPADIRVRREAEALVDTGITVDILCLRGKSEAKKEIVDGVQVYRIPLQRKRSRKIRYIWEYISFISLSFLFLSILYIHKRYKIIHIHNMPDFLVFSSLLPRICGSKIILDLHDPTPEVFMAKYRVGINHPLIKIIIKLEKYSIKYSDVVITPNIAFRDIFIKRGCPEKKIYIVMNSPQEKFFGNDNNKLKKIDNNKFIIMYHGVLVERNGIDIALRAVHLVRNKIPNIIFNVFGEGDFANRFLDLVKELNLNEVVNYYGQVPLNKIVSSIQAAHVGLIPNKPSIHWEHAVPTRIFEYLSQGVPVIAPRTKGIRDYFPNDSIFFTEPGDPRRIAQVILEVYFNPEKVQRVLKKGVSIYKKYMWKYQRKNLEKIVKNLMY